MKIVYGVAALVVLVVAALFVAPYLIDWDGLKPTIAERAELRFGRKLAIDGPIEVRFLPVPRVSVSDVRLVNLPGASVADMARAKRLDLELAIGPLLGGEIEAVKLALIDPVIELERLSSGAANWHFEPKPAAIPDSGKAETAGAPDRAADGKSEPANAGGGVGTAGIQAVELRNGAIVYRDARSKHVEHLHTIDGTVSAREEGGPYQARGSMKLRETPISFEGTLGRGTSATPTPISLDVRLDEAAVRLGFDGSIERDAARAAGALRVEGENFTAALQRFGVALPERAPDLAKSFVLSAAVTGDSARFDAKELQLRVGETSATGAVSYVEGKPSQLDLVLVLISLDLDVLTGAEPERKKGAKGKDAVPEAAIAPAAGPETAAETAGVKLPGDLTASINLTIEAVKYRAAVIRAVQALLSLDKGVITVQQATAELPGGADASLTGKFAAPKGRASFDGGLEIRADDLRTLASWLGVDLSRAPADRLRRLSLAASLKASETDVLIHRLNAKLDGSTIAGSLSVAEASGAAQPQLTANLTLDRLALDAYLPRSETAAGGSTAASLADGAGGADEKPSAAVPSSKGSLLAGYDVAGTLSIGVLSYRDIKLTNLEVNPLWHDGVLTIGELKVADVAGVSLRAKGEGRGFDGEMPQFTATIDASAASLTSLARALDLGGDIRVDALGRSTLGLTLAGTLEKLALDGRLSTEAGWLAFKGEVEQALSEPRYAVDLDLTEATEESIRGLFGRRSARRAVAVTPVSLRGRLSGEEGALAFAAQSIG